MIPEIPNGNAIRNFNCANLVVTSDDNDADAGTTTQFDGITNFRSGWVQHADNTDEGHVMLWKQKIELIMH